MTGYAKAVASVVRLLAIGLLAALFAGGPALAHQGERHGDNERPAAVAAQSGETPPATADQHNMSDMPVSEMMWPTGGEDGMMSHGQRPTTFTGRLIAWLGVWHPAVIHFPIALLLTAAFLELAAAIWRRPIYATSNKILLAVATLGAFAAAPLGWASAGLPASDDETALVLHRWIGTALPFLILLIWWLKKPAEDAAVRASSRLFDTVLALTVIVILAQSYLGAEVTHGAGHMAF